MKISDFIYVFEYIEKEHGDLDVETLGWDERRVMAKLPAVDYRATLKGRESKPRFLSFFYNEEDRKGEKVCRL